MKKIIGLILFFVAVGMLLMLVIHNRFIGLIMVHFYYLQGIIFSVVASKRVQYD